MAEFYIKDGSGKGYRAEVDDHNRLSVKANIVSHEQHHATYHKDFYYIHASTTLAGTSSTTCLYVYNDSQRDAEFYQLIINSDGNFTYEVVTDGTYTSGGNSITGINSNVSSSPEGNLTVYEGGASANLSVSVGSGGTILKGRLSARQCFCYDFRGALVIPPQQSVHINVTGASSDLVEISVSSASHVAGTAL